MRILLAAAVVLAWAGAAEAQTPATTPDYRSEANWLCRPGRNDACAVDLNATIVNADGSTSVETFTPANEPAVDCFYVYPTVSNDPGVNSDMTPNAEENAVIASQFARFSAVCRTYAPLYRQVTLTALRDAIATGQPVDPAAGQLAYADVAAAFRYYIEHDNNGRPFVLIGHSQGSRMLQILVQREIDGQPLQQRMLSAMLAGFNSTAPENADVGGDFRAVPLCRSNTQLGCLITYVSFRADAPPPANSRFGQTTVSGRHVACVNPAALANGETDTTLDSYLGARGAGQSSLAAPQWTSSGANVTTNFVKTPGLLSGRCVRDEHGSYFAVTVHGDPADARTDVIVGDVMSGGRVMADWGLHLIDVSLVQGNLIELVRSQGAAYAAAHHQH